jgi:hypothetical protein
MDSKTRKIILLVLHILCAVAFGAASVIANEMSSRIMHMITSTLWSMYVGMDIADLIFNE